MMKHVKENLTSNYCNILRECITGWGWDREYQVSECQNVKISNAV